MNNMNQNELKRTVMCPHPNRLEKFRIQAQQEYRERTGLELEMGTLEGRAKVSHGYWVLTEQHKKRPGINAKRGICLALREHIDEFKPIDIDIDEVVAVVFPFVPGAPEVPTRHEIEAKPVAVKPATDDLPEDRFVDEPVSGPTFANLPPLPTVDSDYPPPPPLPKGGDLDEKESTDEPDNESDDNEAERF